MHSLLDDAFALVAPSSQAANAAGVGPAGLPVNGTPSREERRTAQWGSFYSPAQTANNPCSVSTGLWVECRHPDVSCGCANHCLHQEAKNLFLKRIMRPEVGWSVPSGHFVRGRFLRGTGVTSSSGRGAVATQEEMSAGLTLLVVPRDNAAVLQSCSWRFVILQERGSCRQNSVFSWDSWRWGGGQRHTTQVPVPWLLHPVGGRAGNESEHMEFQEQFQEHMVGAVVGQAVWEAHQPSLELCGKDFSGQNEWESKG